MGGAVLALLLFAGVTLWLGVNVNLGWFNAFGGAAVLLLLWGLISLCSWAVDAFNDWMDDWAFNRWR